MTSLHCLVAMVTLNSHRQRKSGTCAQVFCFFSPLITSLVVFFSPLCSSSSCHFSISLFLFPHHHPSSSRALCCQVPTETQPPTNSRNQHKTETEEDESGCGSTGGGEGASLLPHKPLRRQAGWLEEQWGVAGGPRRVLGVIV